MAKIAVALQQALAECAVTGAPGQTNACALAQGAGWTVADVICTSGPQDRPFEEQHGNVSIAMVVAGSFQYHRERDHELMTPGSLLLGNTGQCFECRHEHGTGDRCISFSYAPEYFERLAFDVGCRGANFRMLRLPPIRDVSALVARASSGLAGAATVPWEEISLGLAAQVLKLANGSSPQASDAPPSTVARVTRAVRMIESNPQEKLTVAGLARQAGLSPYHFLRTFQNITGLTPHQYVLRARLREAAIRLAAEPEKILDIALDCGFGDVSNFNHAFRAEFGASPRVFRREITGRQPAIKLPSN